MTVFGDFQFCIGSNGFGQDCMYIMFIPVFPSYIVTTVL